MMTKRLQFIALILTIAIGLSSCAFHSGYMTGNASLSSEDFRIVGLAVGRSEAVKVLGLGGFNTEAIVLEAKQDLYRNYPLKKGQALANVTVDFRNAYYILWSKLKVTVSAEIVDFNSDGDMEAAPKPMKLLNDSNSHLVLFKVGDSVIFHQGGKYVNGKIVVFVDDKITIEYFDSKMKNKWANKSANTVFLSEKGSQSSVYKVGIGDKMPIYVTSSKDNLQEIKVEAEVIGLANHSALIKYTDDKNRERIKKVYYEELIKKDL